MAGINRLPRRFPVGTRYVLEAAPAKEGQVQVISRLLVLPDGQEFDLTDATLTEAALSVDRRRRARRSTGRRQRTKH